MALTLIVFYLYLCFAGALPNEIDNILVLAHGLYKAHPVIYTMLALSRLCDIDIVVNADVYEEQ